MHLKPGFFLLLTACAPYSQAVEPMVYSREAQEGVRAILLQNAAVERTGVRNPSAQLLAPVPADPRGQENVFPDVPEAMGARISDAHPLPTEGVRRARGLSAEERRMLRRQIDEVGHDIYAPRR